jgi:GDP-L-fucose synthase
MNKNFDSWNNLKKTIHHNKKTIGFSQYEIIFMKIGTNIGYEQDGKGKDFLRPVLVYKKFNNNVFYGIPLTSKAKNNKFHFEFEYKKNIKSFAILSQLRLFDIKRAKYKDGKISKKDFFKLQDKLQELIVTPLQEEGERTKAICSGIITKTKKDVKMNKTSKIYIAGHRGLVGSAIVKSLQAKGYTNLVYRTHSELDLVNQQAVADFFESEKPEYVILAAAKVGGIVANNTYRADFIYENLAIQNNVIHQSYVHGVKKLLFLGSTCIYPKNAPQPMNEDCLLTSPLEYTNEPYAIAKIAGIKMCESYNLQYGTNFISVMPTNLYGPNDNFDLEKSHVLPALIRKIHLAKLLNEEKYDEVVKDLNASNINEAKEYLAKFGVSRDSVEIWGTGNPRREFLYSEDMADACVFLLESRDFMDTVTPTLVGTEIRNTHINIGTGVDISIKELAELIQGIIGFKGVLNFNTDKPDGTMVKLTDPSKLHNLGWKHKVELENGIKSIYEWYLRDNR